MSAKCLPDIRQMSANLEGQPGTRVVHTCPHLSAKCPPTKSHPGTTPVPTCPQLSAAVCQMSANWKVHQGARLVCTCSHLCAPAYQTSTNLEVHPGSWEVPWWFLDGYWVTFLVGGHLADRCKQVRTNLVPGCLSQLVNIWWTGAARRRQARTEADRCGQRQTGLVPG